MQQFGKEQGPEHLAEEVRAVEGLVSTTLRYSQEGAGDLVGE